jgi:hypothetical protein
MSKPGTGLIASNYGPGLLYTAFFSKVDKQETIVSAKKSHGETEYVSEFIGKYVCFVRTVSKAGQTAKHSRKLQDCLWAFAS